MSILEDTRLRDIEMGVAPYFMSITTENIPQSFLKGQYVPKTYEAVQIRFPGDTRYSPIFPADEMCLRDGNQIITYAERFAEQYRSFLNGSDQLSDGTPLEVLVSLGMDALLLSFCRANKIYSVEAINALEGQNLKNLGMRGNRLKDMARQYLATVNNGMESAEKIAALEAELAKLKSRNVLPVEEFDGATLEEVLLFPHMTDEELKEAIKTFTGSRPMGRPSRKTLEQSYQELKGE